MENIRDLNEKHFGDILNHLNVGVYITDTERRVVFWNKSAEQITGYRADEVVGHKCSDNILRHRDKEGHPLCLTDLCPLHRTMVRGTPSEAPIVVYAVSKTGRDLALSVSTAPLVGDDGQVIGGVEVFRDEGPAIRQMELARAVQRQMLTEQLPVDGRVSFAVQYAPKELVSGDFYHVCRLSDDQFAIFLADAAGHGVSAGLSSALIYSLIMECAESLADPAALMARLNERACARAQGLGFFTAVSITLDAARRSATFCSAGHPPVLVHRANAQVEALTQSHLPVGIQMEAAYENASAELQSGDGLLAFTDGATDIPVGEKGRLGLKGLLGLVSERTPARDPHLTGLFGALMERCATVEPDDDITLVACTFR
jgi:PAS domain S-box-containing protein